MNMTLRTSVFVAVAVALAATLGDRSYSGDSSATDDDCHCSPKSSVYFTVKTNSDGSVAADARGNPEVIQIAAPSKQVAVTAYPLTGTRVSVAAECRTNEQRGTNRRACDSDWSVFTVPDGYVFSKDSRRDDWAVSTGSENDVYVEWADYTDVIPGLQAPRTMKVYVHARSDGIGTRGHSKCTVSAEYVVIPR